MKTLLMPSARVTYLKHASGGNPQPKFFRGCQSIMHKVPLIEIVPPCPSLDANCVMVDLWCNDSVCRKEENWLTDHDSTSKVKIRGHLERVL